MQESDYDYEHKRDEVDDIASAVYRYSKLYGEAAALSLFPQGTRSTIEDLVSIRNCGIGTAAEVFIRAGLYIERNVKGVDNG